MHSMLAYACQSAHNIQHTCLVLLFSAQNVPAAPDRLRARNYKRHLTRRHSVFVN